MNRKRVCGCLAVWCLLVSGVGAESVSSLTWEACLQEARQHNAELAAARAGIDQARADKGVTRSAALPNISASADGTKRSTDGTQSKSYSYGVSGQQLLFDGFKTQSNLAASQEKIKAASYNYQVVSSNVRLDLWSSFVGLLGAQESLEVTRDILKRRQQNLDLVTLRYKVGREHKGSLLTAKANLAQAQYELEEAERSVELYQRRLSRKMGRESFVPFQVRGDLAIPVVDIEKPDFEKLMAESPVLKGVVAEKESARLGLKSARASLFPQVYANAGATKSGAEWVPQTKGWSAGVSIAFPLFEGGKKQAQIDKARAAFEQASSEEKDGRQGVILTLAETWADWQNTASQAAVREEFLAASQERAMIAEGQYSTGLVTFDDWIIIEDDLVSYQKIVLQAKVNALVAEGSWLQAKGVTVDD